MTHMREGKRGGKGKQEKSEDGTEEKKKGRLGENIMTNGSSQNEGRQKIFVSWSFFSIILSRSCSFLKFIFPLSFYIFRG